jgi:hypothetical protein
MQTRVYLGKVRVINRIYNRIYIFDTAAIKERWSRGESFNAVKVGLGRPTAILEILSIVG